jgi:Domain of unknown function (DUF4394)
MELLGFTKEHPMRIYPTAVLALSILPGLAYSEALVGLTNTNNLVSFDSASPTVSTSTSISGLLTGERIVSIDYRNPDNQIYGVSTLGNLYKLNAFTGAAVQVASNVVPVIAAGSTASYGIDLNPQNNNLRVIGNAAAPNRNSAFTFATGLTAVQTPLTGTGGVADIVGAAYNQNFLGSPTSTLNLYYLDANSDALFLNNNAFAGGVLSKVGDLNLNGNIFGLNSATGFDITPSGTAFVSSQQNLYSLNLMTGGLSVLGFIGSASGNFIGLTSAASVPTPATLALMLLGIGIVAGVGRVGVSNKASAKPMW